MAVWYIGVVGLKTCWTAFYDDYTLISRKGLAANASRSVEMLFDLLGIFYAKEGPKAVDFSSKVKTLGLVLDLKPNTEINDDQFFTISHTQSRIDELVATVTSILEKGRVTNKEAEKLRGRLQWFESYASGRVAYQALKKVSSLVSVNRRDFSLQISDVENLKFLRDRILTAAPVKITAMSLQTWVVFTDGSCEGEGTKEGRVGGVLVSPCGLSSFFSGIVSDSIMEILCKDSKHPIYELELLPLLIAFQVWAPGFENQQCVFYVDNEGAQNAMIKGASGTEMGARILSYCVRKELERQVRVWFARVASYSNPADDPSRGKTDKLESLGVKTCPIKWDQVEDILVGESDPVKYGFQENGI